MLTALICSFTLAVLVSLIGFPLALAVRGQGEGWAALLHDALGLGLVTTMLVVLSSAASNAIAPALVLGGYLAVTASALRGKALRSRLPARRSLTPWTIALAVITTCAIVIRLRYVNIVPWVGDMGGYVNWANQYVRSGFFESGFPPLFTVFLAVGGKLFGTAHTAANTPLLGALLLFSTLRLFGQLRVPMAARVAILLVMSVQVHAVWFSSFPASESLQAPLTVMLLSLLLSSLRASGTRLVAALWAVLLVASAISLNRASGILMAGPFLIVLVSCAAKTWRPYAWRFALATASGMIGLYAGYLFGVKRIYAYYVINQISTILPGGLFRRLSGLGLFRISATLLALMFVVVAAILAFGWLVERSVRHGGLPSSSDEAAREAAVSAARTDAPPRRLWQPSLAWLFILVGLAGVGSLVAEGPGEVVQAVGRYGWGLFVIPLVAMLIPGMSLRRTGPVALLASVTMVAFLFLQTQRFDVRKPHLIFLYWDRYLFSEYFPALIAVLGAGAVAASRLKAVQAHRTLAGATVVAVALIGSTFYFNTTRTATHFAAFDQAYAFEKGIVDVVRTEPDAVLWSATSQQFLPSIFPNSWYAFGMPLNMTFGVDVLNLGELKKQGAFGQDPVLGSPAITETLTCGRHAVWIVDVVKSDGPILSKRASSPNYTLEYRGTVTKDLPILSQSRHPAWSTQTVTAQVWRATLTHESAIADPACPTR